MKKILLFISSLLLTLVLVSCQENNDEKNNENKTEQTTDIPEEFPTNENKIYNISNHLLTMTYFNYHTECLDENKNLLTSFQFEPFHLEGQRFFIEKDNIKLEFDMLYTNRSGLGVINREGINENVKYSGNTEIATSGDGWVTLKINDNTYDGNLAYTAFISSSSHRNMPLKILNWYNA